MKSVKTLAVVVAVIMAAFASWAASPVLSDVSLPTTRTDGGKPLMQALKDRQTSRDFSNRKLSAQVLSDLLWAAFGINRPDSG